MDGDLPQHPPLKENTVRTSILALAGLCTALLAGSLPAEAQKPAAKAPAKAGAKPTAKYDESKLAALEAKLKKSPNDARLKSEVAEASYQVGYYIEYQKAGLSPREKYRPALKLYRRALELNPQHAQAKKEKEQIENIYKQMGMPIPQ